MTPYYKDDFVTIYHGDCMEIMPKLGRFDLLVTDPPYGMNYVSSRRKVRHEAIVGDDRLPVEELVEIMKCVDRASYIFMRWNNLCQMPKPKSLIAWVKNNWTVGDLQHEHGRQWEACAFYPAEGHEFIKRTPDVICCAKANSDRHPTEKPIELIQEIIGANVGDTILDPFAGSGTTGRAAKDLGRKCVLIEKEERYCEVSANRMLQEVLPLDF